MDIMVYESKTFIENVKKLHSSLREVEYSCVHLKCINDETIRVVEEKLIIAPALYSQIKSSGIDEIAPILQEISRTSKQAQEIVYQLSQLSLVLEEIVDNNFAVIYGPPPRIR